MPGSGLKAACLGLGICAGVALAALSGGAAAAQALSDQRFSPRPVCSELINKTGFTVRGSLQTDTLAMPDGTVAHHKSNFKLAPDERSTVCSSGPFFTGGTLELTIRSLVPLFACRTKLGKPITLNARRNAADTGYDWSATCHE